MKFDALFNSINEQTVSDLVTGPEWNMKGKDAPFKPVTKAQKASRSAGPKLGAAGALLSKAAKKAQAKLASKKELKESVGSVTIKQILKEYTSNWLNENTNEGPDLRYVADLAKQNQTDIKTLVMFLRDPEKLAKYLKNAGKMITGGHGEKPQENIVGSQVSGYEKEHPADTKNRVKGLLKGLFEKYRAGIKLL